MWFLVITLKQVCNEKEQAVQKGRQNAQFETEKDTRNFNVGAKAWDERDKVTERSSVMWNKGRERPHFRKLPTCKMRGLKNYLLFK